MTQLTLELDDEKDTRLFVELAERLKVRFKKETKAIVDKDLVSHEERQRRLTGLKQFEGQLSTHKGYEPSKEEFYEQ